MNKKEQFVKDFTSILVKRKIVPDKEAESLQNNFEEASQERFDEFLLDEGLVDKEDILKGLQEYYQVPAIDLVGYFFQTFLLRKFPKGVMIRNLFIPLEADQNIMLIATADPEAPELLSKIGEFVSYDIQFRVTIAQDIINAVQEFYDKSDTEMGEEWAAYDDYGDMNVYEIGADEEYSSPGEEED